MAWLADFFNRKKNILTKSWEKIEKLIFINFNAIKICMTSEVNLGV